MTERILAAGALRMTAAAEVTLQAAAEFASDAA